jgi:hypothetical protein
MPGVSVEIVKEFNPKTQRISFKSNSAKVKSAEDLVSLEQQEKELRMRKIGAINESLWDKLKGIGENDPVDAIVVLKISANFLLPDKTIASERQQREQAEAFLKIRPLVNPEALSARHKITVREKVGGSQFICTLTKKAILELGYDPDVAAIEEFVPQPPAGSGDPDFNTLASSAYNHSSSPVPPSAGAGINAATFESGLTQDFVNCLGIPLAQQSWLSITPSATEHSMSTFRCMLNAAPGANHYHNSSSGYSFSSDSLFLYNNAIKTTSASASRGGQSAWDATRYEFRQMDNFAYILPYPVFVIPSSNDGYHYIENWNFFF